MDYKERELDRRIIDVFFKEIGIFEIGVVIKDIFQENFFELKNYWSMKISKERVDFVFIQGNK